MSHATGRLLTGPPAPAVAASSRSSPSVSGPLRRQTGRPQRYFLPDRLEADAREEDFAEDALAGVAFLGAVFAAADLATGLLAAEALAAPGLVAEVFVVADFVDAVLAVAVLVAVLAVAAGARLGTAFFAAEPLVAVRLVEVFLAGAVSAVLAGVFFAGARVALLAGAFADVFFAGAAFLAAVPVTLDLEVTAPLLLLGKVLGEETNALKAVPGLNFGTDVFLMRTVWPVRGFRPVRAARAAFSNVPKPLMATRSPRATVRTMVSITDSTASTASFRLPNLVSRVSTRSPLFTSIFPPLGAKRRKSAPYIPKR